MNRIAGKRSLLWAVILAVGSQVGLALTPHLINNAPLVLLILRPQPEMIVLLAGGLPALAIIAVAAPLRWFLHLIYVELGRWTGEEGLERIRLGRWLRPRLANGRIRRLMLASCIVHLGTPVDLAMGAGDIERHKVVPALGVGALLTTTAFVLLGEALAPGTEQVIEWIADHRPLASAVAFVLACLGLLTVRQLLPRSHPEETNTDPPNPSA